MKITHSCGHVIIYNVRVTGNVDPVELMTWKKEQEAKPCPVCKSKAAK